MSRKLLLLTLLPLAFMLVGCATVDISAFAWPLAVSGTLLGLFFLGLLRSPIAALINRITQVSKDGLITGATSLQVSDKPGNSVSESLLEALDATSSSVIEQQDLIRKIVADAHLVDQAEQIKFLTHHLALSNLILIFEHIRDQIFGSQMKVVTAANANPNGFTQTVIRQEYDMAAATWPAAYEGRAFEDWLQFITSSGLVVITNDLLFITPRGREFLTYLIQTGKNHPKNL